MGVGEERAYRRCAGVTGIPGWLVKKWFLCQDLGDVGSQVCARWIQGIPKSFSMELRCTFKFGTRLAFQKLDGDPQGRGGWKVGSQGSLG